jgi:hypothetical protein
MRICVLELARWFYTRPHLKARGAVSDFIYRTFIHPEIFCQQFTDLPQILFCRGHSLLSTLAFASEPVTAFWRFRDSVFRV